MKNNNNFCELSQNDQMNLDGGVVLIGFVIACAVTQVAALVTAPIIYRDLKNVYNNGYNEIKYK